MSNSLKTSEENISEVSASLTQGATAINIKQSVDSHSSDELKDTECVTSAAFIELPTTSNCSSGSSIINESTWSLYKVGDLFWGQIYNYCYWPCMVCPDRDSKDCVMKNPDHKGIVQVHVRFFADNGRRNWVKHENLIPFINLQCYLIHLAETEEKFGTKSAKYKILLPTKSQQFSWNVAIKEADIIAQIPVAKRVQKFEEIVKESRILREFETQINKSVFTNNINSSDISKSKSSTSNGSRKRKVSQDYDNINEDKSAYNNNLAIDASGINLQHYDIFNTKDFQTFHTMMKDFVFQQYEDDTLEKTLLTDTRKLWAVKHISSIKKKEQLMGNSTKLDSTSVYNNDDSALELLSTRLKTMFTRKQQ